MLELEPDMLTIKATMKTQKTVIALLKAVKAKILSMSNLFQKAVQIPKRTYVLNPNMLIGLL